VSHEGDWVDKVLAWAPKQSITLSRKCLSEIFYWLIFFVREYTEIGDCVLVFAAATCTYFCILKT
jgi:hypothetical protein